MTCWLKFKEYCLSGCSYSGSHRGNMFIKILAFVENVNLFCLKTSHIVSLPDNGEIVYNSSHVVQGWVLSHMDHLWIALSQALVLRHSTPPTVHTNSVNHSCGGFQGLGGCTVSPVSCMHWPFVCQLFLVLNWSNYSLHLANLSSFHHLSRQMI